MNNYEKFFGPEDNLQIACVRWFALEYPHLFPLLLHPQNEGKRSRFERYKFKRMGMQPGWPDLMLMVPKYLDSIRGYPGAVRHGLAAELKVKPNKPTQAQLDKLDALSQEGWETHVCYSLEDFQKIVRDYLGE